MNRCRYLSFTQTLIHTPNRFHSPRERSRRHWLWSRSAPAAFLATPPTRFWSQSAPGRAHPCQDRCLQILSHVTTRLRARTRVEAAWYDVPSKFLHFCGDALRAPVWPCGRNDGYRAQSGLERSDGGSASQEIWRPALCLRQLLSLYENLVSILELDELINSPNRASCLSLSLCLSVCLSVWSVWSVCLSVCASAVKNI